MSALERLRAAVEAATTDPYLLTVTADDRPWSDLVAVAWDAPGERLVVTPTPDHWAASEAGGRRQVSLLWPPAERGGYSLILNGEAGSTPVDGEPRLVIERITKGVLHRPAATLGDAGPCGSDCRPLFVARPPSGAAAGR